MRRRRLALVGMSIAVALAVGCTRIAILSGPSTLSVGELATYVLSLSGSHWGSNLMYYVVAEVPIGWSLTSSSYTGTAGGVPISGSGTVVTGMSSPCLNGPRDGFQYIWVAAGPYSTTSSDTAQATLQLAASALPAGEFAVRFWFVTSDDYSCNSAEAIVNRGSRLFSLARTLTSAPDQVLEQNNSCAFSSDGMRVVFAGEGTTGDLAVFSRDETTGDLEHLSTYDDPHTGFVAVAISPDDQHLYAVGDRFVEVLRPDPASGIVTLVQTVEVGLEGVRGVAVSPDGASVYTVSNADLVAAFSRNAGTGELGLLGFHSVWAPHSVVVSPDGENLYVGGNWSLTVLDRDPASGMLTFREEVPISSGFVTGLAVSSDGRHLYVPQNAGNTDNSILVFSREDGTGALTMVDEIVDGEGDVWGIWGVDHLALSADGTHIAASGWNETLVILEREPLSGALTFLQADVDLEQVLSTGFSPEGEDLYLLGGDDRVRVYARWLFGDGFEAGDTTGWTATQL